MFCSQCGKTIPDDSKFCLSCGKEIVIETSSPTDTPTTPEMSDKDAAKYGCLIPAIIAVLIIIMLASCSSSKKSTETDWRYKHWSDKPQSEWTNKDVQQYLEDMAEFEQSEWEKEKAFK